MALIQKTNATHIDFASVFYVNLVVSVILYFAFFLSAPAIARFYNLPLLSKVLRVQAFVLIINSLSVVQLSILKRDLRFKDLAKRDLLSAFIGLSAGIICAFCGLGVWSLVINLLATNIVGSFLLWSASDWRPTLEFSFVSLRQLFSFGGLMMLSSLLGTIFDNLQSLIIGKFFSASELGYVNQAKKLEGVPSGAISSVVTQVSFPVFAQIQDNREKLRYGVRKNVLAVQYINLPILVLLMVIAEPLILFLYGRRWATSIPYFQILCISHLVGAIVPINLSVLSAKGKGNTYLFTQIIKCLLAIGVISLSVKHGIYALLFSFAMIPYIEFIVGAIINKRVIGYGCFKQVFDMLPMFGITVLAAVSSYVLKFIIPVHIYLLMAIQIIVFLTVYFGLTKLFKFEAYGIYIEIIKSRLHKRDDACKKYHEGDVLT